MYFIKIKFLNKFVKFIISNIFLTKLYEYNRLF